MQRENPSTSSRDASAILAHPPCPHRFIVHLSDYAIYKAAAKRPAAAATPIGRAKAVGADAALPEPVASAAAELAALEIAPSPLLTALLAVAAALLSAPPDPVALPVADGVVEPVQPADVGRFVTPTGWQMP